jgi:hypothetical protein
MMSKSFPTSSMWLLGFLLTAIVSGCGGDGGGGAPLGSLSVSLTDAPACGFDEVNVTVDKVRVHQSNSANENTAGWTTIALVPPRKINLLDLNDPTQPNLALEELGVTPLPAGQYTQVRLVLVGNIGNQPTANWIVLSGTNPINDKIPLDTPSAVQSGIKLIHPFTVNQGQRVDLLLDFDACTSIVKTGSGKYKLKPVIQVIPFELNGIRGFIDTALFPGQANANNVIVSAQMGGNIVRSAVPNATTGEFFLARLDPGNYDVVITADNRATAVIAGVPVATSTSITPVSTSGSPLSLNGSGVQSINGAVMLNPADDDGTVNVVAKQALVGGPTVTVKSQNATLKDNTPTVGDYEYNLTLPIAAPALAPFGPLPIIPTDAGQIAGVYSIHGSAQTPTTTYATQSPALPSVDISGGNATRDFTLTP